MYDKKQLKLYIEPEILKAFKLLAIQEDKKLSTYIQEIMQKEIEKKSKRYVYHKNLTAAKPFFIA